MAKITRLASTLIARYYPSKTLTDAFYMDGRLFGKREIRNADITIDKEERGFFFSVFSHPAIPGYEPGMVPPYEPQLRSICNEVKFGRKPIDEMISGFLTTAVDITGKMKLQDQDNRAPYFSGIIVHDSEAFAVTIGSGLAFLYRNDALYPLTDAGIPMEPIDAFGNRVGDFYNYVSSKTANALWSNITTLSIDDCIILCNKAVYDALGQRELLRILDEAEDQCDAAGTVITQAAANMPNVPMQFSISFVESVTADEKKGFFSKFGKKNKEEDMENMSIKSTFEGGIIGAAAGAVANAGFTTGVDAASVAANSTTPVSFDFGDAVVPVAPAVPVTPVAPVAPVVPTVDIPVANTSEEPFGIVVPETVKDTDPGVQFLDSSVDVAAPKEVSAEEMIKNLFGEMEASKAEGLELQKKAEDEAKAISPFVMEEPTPAQSIIAEGTAFAPQSSEIPSDSPFISAFNPFAETPEVQPMETVSEVPFEAQPDDAMMDTKTVNAFDSLFAQQVQSGSGISSNGIIAAALREMQAESNANIKEEKSEEIVTPDVAEAPVVAPVNADEPVVVAPVIPEVKEEASVVQVINEPVVEAPSFTIDEQPAQTVDPVTVNNDEITFTASQEVLEFGDSKPMTAPFNPYEIGKVDDIETMNPVVFPGQEAGDFDVNPSVVGGEQIMDDSEKRIDEPSFEWKEEGIPTEQIASEVPVPDFQITQENQTVNPVENVSFPVSTAPNAEPENPVSPAFSETPVVPNEPEVVAPADSYVLPFENAVYAEPEPVVPVQDIPDMPLYGGQTFDTPTYAVNSEQPLDDMSTQAYSVGEYTYNEDMSVEQAPYQTYGSEIIDDGMIDPVPQQPIQSDMNYNPNPSYVAPEAPVGYEQPVAPVDAGYVDPGYVNPGYVDPAYQQPPIPETEIPVDGMGGEIPAADDEWVNSILGLGSDDVAGTNKMNYIDPNADMSTGTPQKRSATPNGRPGAAKRPSTTSGRPGGPNGNGKKKKFKLSRNGIIFLTFVGVLLISLIVIISLIIKSCTSDETKTKETDVPTTSESVIETIPTPTPVPDPKAAIGVFVFSDYTGYRTWYDLFDKVYAKDGITIENYSDPRIAIICQYNGAGEGYVPASGDQLLLPPIGVLNGSIPLDDTAAPTGDDTAETTPEGEVSGEPVLAE